MSGIAQSGCRNLQRLEKLLFIQARRISKSFVLFLQGG